MEENHAGHRSSCHNPVAHEARHRPDVVTHQNAAGVGGPLKDRRIVLRAQTNVLHSHEVGIIDAALEPERQIRVYVFVSEKANLHVSSRARTLARSPSASGNSASTRDWISAASRSCCER